MDSGKVLIKRQPPLSEVEKAVDDLIHGEMNEFEIKAFVALIELVADFEDDQKGAMAQTIIRRAYTHTEAFDTAVKEFQRGLQI